MDTNNSQAEMYLTDIVAIARRSGQQVQPFFHDQPQDVLGVNSRVELAQAEAILQEFYNSFLTSLMNFLISFLESSSQ